MDYSPSSTAAHSAPSLKTHLQKLIVWSGLMCVATFCLLMLMSPLLDELDKWWFRKDPEIRRVEHEEYLKTTRAAGQVKRAMIYALPVSGLLLTCVVVGGLTRVRLKKASIHTYKLGQHNEIVVHERDLAIAAPIALGLVEAQQLRESHAGLENALEVSDRILAMSERAVRTRCRLLDMSRPALPDTVGDPGPAPAFADLLRAEQIAPGRPMILGFEKGAPRYGSFLDIYSSAVAGESGSGKTATLLFLIASGLIAERVRYVGIDPHYPHPKSLGFKTKPLWDAGLMTMATFKDDMARLLREIEQTIDNRLAQRDTDDTPVVLVIDELAFLAKTSLGPTLAHTMERISTEGRKCAVYMLASSQTWLVARTGESSVVRDTLTSAFVHRIKPKQANLLLQDKEEADKVKKYVKQPGDVLLCPVNDDSVLVKMPYTTEADMQTVAGMLARDHSPIIAPSVLPPAFAPRSAPALTADPEVDAAFEALLAEADEALSESAVDADFDLSTDAGLRRRIAALRQAGTLSYGAIERETGIGKSSAHNWINDPARRLKPEQHAALRGYLERLG